MIIISWLGLYFRSNVLDMSFNNLCSWLSETMLLNKCNLVEVGGDVCSGRTTCLLNIYQNWATAGSKLNERFFFLLPLIRREELYNLYALENTVSSSQEDENIEDRICQSFEKWAPNCYQKLGRKTLLDEVNALEKNNILALVDQCDGHFTFSSTWSGISVQTAFPASDHSITQYAAVNTFHAKLQPLSEDVIKKIIKQHCSDNELSNLFNKFERQLKSPHHLKIFQSIVRKSTGIFDLNYLLTKMIIDDGNKWLERKSKKTCVGVLPGNYCCENKLSHFAFNGVLTNNYNISQNCRCKGNQRFDGICCQQATPPYLISAKQNFLQFRDRNIMFLLAASHVINKYQVAAWDWLRKPFDFKSVFLYVVQKLVDENKEDSYAMVLHNFLSVYLKFYVPVSEIKIHVDRSSNCTLEDVGFEQKPKLYAVFSKFCFLTKIDNICRGNPTIMNILKNMMCKFNIWSVEWNSIKTNEYRFLKNIFQIIKEDHIVNPTCCNLKELKLVGNISEQFNFHIAAELLSLLPFIECEIKVSIILNPCQKVIYCLS